MKKVLVGILITGLIFVGGCVATAGLFVNSVDSVIEEMEQEQTQKDDVYAKVAESIEWKIEDSGYSKKIIGVLENTLDEEIDYIQFEYKLYDTDGVVVEKSFTNEVDIASGEKRKVEFYLIANEFDTYEIVVKASPF